MSIPHRVGASRRAAVAMAGACLIALLCASHAAAAPTVYVFPIPGSHVAPPHAQIVFRGIPASKIGSITVTGSRSGKHGGKIAGDSDGNGGSFLPSSAFTPGETVTVRTHLNIDGKNTGTWNFHVATPAPRVSPVRWSPAPRRSGDIWQLHSRPDITPPAVQITTHGQTAPGDIFLGPQSGPLQVGPEILDPNGNLIWFKSLRGDDSPSDVRVQTLYGKPVLTWWQGFVSRGVGIGEDVINDTTYRVIDVVRAAGGLNADLHEFFISPQNTAFITAEEPVRWNLSAVGGSRNGIVFDSVVQEIDIKTGLLLYQWDSLDHVRIKDSYQTIQNSPWFDYFHVNSIEPQSDGTLLISARCTSAIYKIDRHTGKVIWILGGKRSSFHMGSGATFAFQHDAHAHGPGGSVITMFDDGSGPFKVNPQSRALTLVINTATMTADRTSEIDHQPAVSARAEGNYQLLNGGDGFVGWAVPYFSEYNATGQLVFDGRFVDSGWSYRAYRFQWTGNPQTTPKAAASTSSGHTTVWASWNGATNVSSWRVLGGSSSSNLQTVANQVTKTGFETAITISAESYVAVQALDSHGHVLSTSPTVHS